MTTSLIDMNAERSFSLSTGQAVHLNYRSVDTHI
jgi:hypothetical protein